MNETLQLLLGAGLLVGGAFLVQMLSSFFSARKQEKLEQQVKEINDRKDKIESSIDNHSNETLRKIDEITKEQNNQPSGSNLADWFDKRHGE